MATYCLSLRFKANGTLAYGDVNPVNSVLIDSFVANKIKANKPKKLTPYQPFKVFEYVQPDGSKYEYFIVKMTTGDKKKFNSALKAGMNLDEISRLITTMQVDKMSNPFEDESQFPSVEIAWLPELLTYDYFIELGGKDA